MFDLVVSVFFIVRFAINAKNAKKTFVSFLLSPVRNTGIKGLKRNNPKPDFIGMVRSTGESNII